ncbi:MAG: DUF4198 domain-containing protein [Pseudomonadota bacterium]
MIRTRLLLAVLTFALSAGVAQGHEFWIDPVEFTVDVGDPIVADLRVGEAYLGGAQSYLPNRFRRFEIVQGAATAPVDGRMGDRPALNQTADEGLAVLVHVTTDSRLTYQEFAKFASFVTHKDAPWTIAEHSARNLPQEGFAEVYSRYAKSLVAVGDGAGSDRVVGLETEIVAQTNPYTDDLSDGMIVTLYYQGAPRADAQIEIFEKNPSGEVAVSTLRTDAVGVARVPVRAGHRYMLDSVVLRAPDIAAPSDGDPVWESLWANLTFEVPEAP